MRFLHPDGGLRWVWANVTPTPGPNGEKWTLGILQDITDRKAAENALRQSEEELAAIAAVARCVQSGTDPRPVVVDSIRTLSGAALVRLLEPTDDGELVVTAGDRSQDDAAFGPGSDGRCGAAVRTGDVRRQPTATSGAPPVRRSTSRSWWKARSSRS